MSEADPVAGREGKAPPARQVRIDYVPHAQADVVTMLDAVGAGDIGDLFSEISRDVRLSRPLDLPAGVPEVELLAELRALAARTTPASELVSFLGAGVYDHYVPAVVDAIVHRRWATEERMTLDVRLLESGDVVHSTWALNGTTSIAETSGHTTGPPAENA